MAKERQNILTAIDLGSAKTCVMVAQITEQGLRYRAHGICDSRGSRKGTIVDLDGAVESVQKAVEQAEVSGGIAVENAIVGAAGAHVRGVNSQGGIAVGGRAREIGRDEISDRVAARDPVGHVVELRRPHAENLPARYFRASTARCSCCLFMRERPEIPIRFASL